MTALFHFIFTLVKIAILGALYALIITLIISLYLKTSSQRFDVKYIRKRIFMPAYQIITTLLFIFSFTYYGNHGLGDDYNIPLGHGEVMRAGDLYAYFEPDAPKSPQISVNSYEVSNAMLCAKSDSFYFVYQLQTKKIIKFKNDTDYNNFAAQRNLPVADQFKDFLKQYNKYWSGWRLWLLP